MADRVGALVAYPDALRGQWNQAPAVLGSEPDDVRFLVQLVDTLVAAACADGRVTGGTHGWFKSPIDANDLSWAFFAERSG
jgi:poly(3-hydroxybutyrate) depolymerase